MESLTWRSPPTRCALGLAALVVLTHPAASFAQGEPFGPGWRLDAQVSALRFQSVKNETKVESSSFATLEGGISADGEATVSVLLDSVDTGIDLRNVRMRFLFFETFEHPSATITAKIDENALADLAARRRLTLTQPYTLDLHGVTQPLEAEITVTLLTDDLVSVASAAPISIAAETFGLDGGITKLEEAAGVDIIPSATVSFDFVFARAGASAAPTVVAAAAAASAVEASPTVQPTAVALETAGDFSQEECVGRFEILSRTDNIVFRSGSARLGEASAPILATVVDIVSRCPDLVVEVSGHTDSDGSDAANQRLSEARARAVRESLAQAGIAPDRVVAVGHGEAKPAFPNDTAENKRRNRRIEFAVAGR